jgi:hypothetical protein
MISPLALAGPRVGSVSESHISNARFHPLFTSVVVFTSRVMLALVMSLSCRGRRVVVLWSTPEAFQGLMPNSASG